MENVCLSEDIIAPGEFVSEVVPHGSTEALYSVVNEGGEKIPDNHQQCETITSDDRRETHAGGDDCTVKEAPSDQLATPESICSDQESVKETESISTTTLKRDVESPQNIPTAVDEQSSQPTCGADDAEESPSKRRRSSRNHNRIALWERTSLPRRRFEQFFNESPQEQASSSIRIANWTLERVHSSPNIYTIDNFLTPADLEYLFTCVESMPFEQSFVDDPVTGECFLDTSHRTSTFLSFHKQQNAKIVAIEQRAATLMGFFSLRPIEALQLVRYHTNQFFNAHHDMGDYNPETGVVDLPPKHILNNKRRLVTIFCYLNDVEKGGYTQFPLLGLNVEPKAGRAVIWQNVLHSGLPDARTVHAGTPVEEGIKYALNIWLCEE